MSFIQKPFFYSFLVVFTGIHLFCFNSFAQPKAQFSATPVSGCSPLIVQFTDLSTGSPTTWLWRFGNGNVSTQKNPSAVYSTPGTYTITLVVSNGSVTDSLVKTAFVTVFSNPIANFSANQLIGCPPFNVNFSDLSTPGSAPVTTWIWDFGDGSTGSTKNPSHSYTTPGVYSVTLTVIDANGCRHTFFIPNYITVTKPIAAFTGLPLNSCKPPLNVVFTNTSTGTAPLTYLWNFGDSTTSTLQNPSHNYTIGGFRNVKLVVTDKNGCKDSLTRNNYVSIVPLTADFNADTSEGCAGSKTFTFSDLTTSSPTTWSWNFGDGFTATTKNPTHLYSTPGTYTIRLIASNASGCSDTVIKTITVHPKPSVGFSADTLNSCGIPFTVTFSDTSINGNSWLWRFGDGSISTLQNPVHSYSNPDTFSVTLVVTSSKGCVDSVVKTNYINITQPIAMFDTFPRSGCIPLTVNFNDTSFSREPIVSWLWNFGDGNTSTLQNPTHVYTTEGIFTVTLVVTNAQGCKDTLTITNLVQAGNTPVSNFAAAPLVGCASVIFNFSDSSTGGPTSWLWMFGDGGMSTLQNPTYAYSDTGWFDVTLIAIRYGCADTLVRPQYIQILAPIAQFSIVQTCADPYTVNFIDGSIGPDIWQWDFGDTVIDSIANPTHTYTATGNYSVTLIVTNLTTGCVHSAVVGVSIRDPEAKFSFAPDSGCYPVNVTFSDSSLFTTGWLWDFGDGATSTAQSPSHLYTAPGTYKVKLIVTDAVLNNCTDSLEKTVLVRGPIPWFGIDTTTGCTPLPVTFTDSTVTDTILTKWAWSFGDGGIDSVQNPVHLYTVPNVYSISLTVTDAYGCSATIIRQNLIVPTYPTPAFTASVTRICKGQSVTFTNQSVGLGMKFKWDFGDGGTDSVLIPTHTYLTGGTFSVTLTATDTNLCDSTLIKNLYITVEDPVANFTASPTYTPCPPLYVSFTDSSYGGNINQWTWTFGNSNTSVLKNPFNTYSVAGTYDVTLIISTAIGCRDTIIKPKYITVGGPSGSYTVAPDSGCAPLPVQFVANGINVFKYTWDFGDGNISNLDSLIHSYTIAGIFHPTLILEDSAGCKVALPWPDSIMVNIIPHTLTPNPTICYGDSIRLVATGGTSYVWSPAGGLSSTTAASPWAKPVTDTKYYLRVINGTCFVDDSVTIKVDTSVIASFYPTPDVGFTPLNIQFVNTSLNAVTYFWAFNDGDKSTVKNPVHTYRTAGNYTVMLIAYNAQGCKDTAYYTFIKVDVNSHIYVPNIFTPNGDGVNDELLIDMIGLEITEGRIFNRWGTVIYEWYAQKSGFWDGRTNTGTEASDGVYYYIFKAKGNDGKIYEANGFVTLVR